MKENSGVPNICNFTKCRLPRTSIGRNPLNLDAHISSPRILTIVSVLLVVFTPTRGVRPIPSQHLPLPSSRTSLARSPMAFSAVQGAHKRGDLLSHVAAAAAADATDPAAATQCAHRRERLPYGEP